MTVATYFSEIKSYPPVTLLSRDSNHHLNNYVRTSAIYDPVGGLRLLHRLSSYGMIFRTAVISQIRGQVE